MKTSMTLDQWKVDFGAHFAKRPSFCEHCDKQWHRHDDPLMVKLCEESRILLTRMLDGNIVGVMPFYTTYGLVIGVTETQTHQRRYCYQRIEDAIDALVKYKDVDKHATGPWIKVKGVYRGRPIDDFNKSFLKSTHGA